jgi:hypothetical protein
MRSILVACLFTLLPAHALQARTWRDATGKYAVEGDLIASTDEQIVLKRTDGRLVVMETSQLSEADRQYLATPKAAEQAGDDPLQTWTLTTGWKITGRLVGYARKDVVIQRKRGKVYVNDRLLDNLPEIYRRMLPRIVAHEEGIELANERQLVDWVVKQKGQPRKFTIDGVLIELENGDEYGVPLMFFSAQDRQVFEPGWQQWLAAHEDAERRQREDFLLQAQAEAYHRDRQQLEQIHAMQLMLSAVDAGVVDLWEVQLLPKRGVAARPQIAVVPARNSQQAISAALARNPNFVAGPARRLN